MEKFLLSVLLLLSMLTQRSLAIPCIPQCKCFWLKGKEAADCSSAGFETIPDGLEPSVQVLNLTQNKFPVLPRRAFYNVSLINLQKVYLTRCGIERIDDWALKQLVLLVELHLDHNAISYVPSAAFLQLPNLRVLDLSDNPLTVVPTLAFPNLPRLKILRMSDCQIRTIATRAFEGLEMLEVVGVGGNELSTLRVETLEMFKFLKGVTLDGNPWTCDCELDRLRRWLNDHKVSYIQPTCYRPVRQRGKKWSEVTVEDCPPTSSLNTTVDVSEKEEGGKPNEEEKGISRVFGMVFKILSAVL